MESAVTQDHQILVLASGETTAFRNNAKGHLFEEFVGLLLAEYGYAAPEKGNFNVTADGIEIDVTAISEISRHRAIVECKAYTSNVKAQAVTSFLGKLQMARYEYDAQVHGFFFALPRLVAAGEEISRKAQKADPLFRYLHVGRIVDLLQAKKLIRDARLVVSSETRTSDPAVLITADGTYSCAKVLDASTRRADHIIVWGSDEREIVPDGVLRLLRDDSYATGLPIKRSTEIGAPSAAFLPEESAETVAIVTVRGSSEDFEYQFPASPAYFVGRKSLLQDLDSFIDTRSGVVVLNAHSGWGKSSLALQMAHMVSAKNGYSIVVDSRTAYTPRFISEALRRFGLDAQEKGVLALPPDSSWASLPSAMLTLRRATWTDSRPCLVFFDQFENVFQDELTTREFRDLALMVSEGSIPLMVGFAWKTDLVGWTESYPFRHRDEIIASSKQIPLGPLGAQEVGTLLDRLQRRLSAPLSRDLGQRVREYSQGLPWLFKKLSGHIIRELEIGQKSQEQLVSEALNVQSLFDSDLAGLSPVESDALKYIARIAPVSAMDVTDRYGSGVIQSLLHQRLVVAVGGQLDTYWDTFRDFLNTGRVPIEDSYIVRQTPQAVAQLLSAVVQAGGDASVASMADRLGVSAKAIYNRSREMRLFGLTTYESNRVRLLPELTAANDMEGEIRQRVTVALRRNRAYSSLLHLAEHHGGPVPISSYAAGLPDIFPAVDAQPASWMNYARAFARWFDYCGLSIYDDDVMRLPPDGYMGRGSMNGPLVRRSSSFTLRAPARAIKLLEALASGPTHVDELPRLGKDHQKAVRELLVLGLVIQSGQYLAAAEGVLDGDGNVIQEAIINALRTVPGGSEAVDALIADANISNHEIGRIIRERIGVAWEASTTFTVGKDFRGWVKRGGIRVGRARAVDAVHQGNEVLF